MMITNDLIYINRFNDDKNCSLFLSFLFFYPSPLSINQSIILESSERNLMRHLDKRSVDQSLSYTLTYTHTHTHTLSFSHSMT